MTGWAHGLLSSAVFTVFWSMDLSGSENELLSVNASGLASTRATSPSSVKRYRRPSAAVIAPLLQLSLFRSYHF
jgi:hypothetical protein